MHTQALFCAGKAKFDSRIVVDGDGDDEGQRMRACLVIQPPVWPLFGMYYIIGSLSHF